MQSPAAETAEDARKKANAQHQRMTRINNESCEIAAKHVNVVYGRPETDKMGTTLLFRCMNVGNLAWYGCVMEANTPESVATCNRNLLDAPH